MVTVYKYPLGISDVQEVVLPRGAQLLRVDEQDEHKGRYRQWMLEPPVKRRIRIAGTGHPLPGYHGTYLNTFFADGGRLVFHAFDMGQAT
jgi:hypothetical protein